MYSLVQNYGVQVLVLVSYVRTVLVRNIIATEKTKMKDISTKINQSPARGAQAGRCPLCSRKAHRPKQSSQHCEGALRKKGTACIWHRRPRESYYIIVRSI